MFGKWRSLLLSLALILSTVLIIAAPVGATAETQYTMALAPDEALPLPQGVFDLLDAVQLRVVEDENSGALSFMVNGEEAVTLAMAFDENGMYLASDIVGEKPLYFSWDDAFDAMEGMLMDAGDAQTEMNAESLKAAFEAFYLGFQSGETFSAKYYDVESADEALELIEELFPDDPGMAAYFKAMFDKVEVEEGSFPAENRDTADSKITMRFTNEDYIAIYDTQYMRSVLEMTVDMENPDATQAERNAAIEEALDEARSALANSDMSVTLEMYMQGEQLVGMEMDMTAAENEVSEEVRMHMDYALLTDDSGISYQASMHASEDDELVELSLEGHSNHDGTANFEFHASADEDGFSLIYEKEALNEGSVCELTLYIVSAAGSADEENIPIGSLIVKSEPVTDETLAALKNADAKDCIDLFAISEDDLVTLGDQIVDRTLQTFQNVVMNLPASFLEMLSEGIGE